MQLIVIFTEAANLLKQVIGIIGDLAIMARKKRPQQQSLKFRPNKEYFNFGKKSYYVRDCPDCTNLKKKPEDERMEQKVKRVR